jgi:hypothetical protein
LTAVIGTKSELYSLAQRTTLSQFREVDDGRPEEKDFQVKNAQSSCCRVEASPFLTQFVSAML